MTDELKWPERPTPDSDADRWDKAFCAGQSTMLDECTHAGVKALTAKLAGGDIEKLADALIRSAWNWGESCEIDGIAWGEKGDSHNEWMRDRAMEAKRNLLAAIAALVSPPPALSEKERA